MLILIICLEFLTTYICLGDVLFQTKYYDLIQSLVAGSNVVTTILAIIALVAVVAILFRRVASVAITITTCHGIASVSITITIV